MVSDDFAVIDLVVPELQKLCQYAKDRSVRIMIDAEQTYFQAAIDDVTLHLCRTVNPPMTATQVPMGAKAVVFNTYQMYLVDALARLKLDVERSNRYGFTFGAKIVRGNKKK